MPAKSDHPHQQVTVDCRQEDGITVSASACCQGGVVVDRLATSKTRLEQTSLQKVTLEASRILAKMVAE